MTCITMSTYKVVGWRQRLVIVTMPDLTSLSLKMTATGAPFGNHLQTGDPPPVQFGVSVEHKLPSRSTSHHVITFGFPVPNIASSSL